MIPSDQITRHAETLRNHPVSDVERMNGAATLLTAAWTLGPGEMARVNLIAAGAGTLARLPIGWHAIAMGIANETLGVMRSDYDSVSTRGLFRAAIHAATSATEFQHRDVMDTLTYILVLIERVPL